MKAVALYILTIPTIAQAGPWNYRARRQGLVRRQGGSNGPDEVNVGSSTARGFTKLVGGNGVIKSAVQIQAYSTSLRPRFDANNASSERQRHAGEQPSSGKLLSNNQQSPPDNQQAPVIQEATTVGFEGLRVSTVTVTAPGNAAAGATATATVTQLASQEKGGAGSTVFITGPASTVTQTVTATCTTNPRQEQLPQPPAGGGQNLKNITGADDILVLIGGGQGNGQDLRASKLIGQIKQCSIATQGIPQIICNGTAQSNIKVIVSTANSASQRQADILPTPNANGNGVGVSTIPIPESARPKTTRSVKKSASLQAVKGIQKSTKLTSGATVTAKPSGSSRPVSPSSRLASPSPTAASSSPTPTSSSSRAASLSSSTPPPSRPSDSLALGKLSSSAAAGKNSAVAPGATPGPGVIAPEKPAVKLSGHSLKSVVDLGNLKKRKQEAKPTSKA